MTSLAQDANSQIPIPRQSRASDSTVRILGRAFWMAVAALSAMALTAGLTYEANRREEHAVAHARERGRLGREAHTSTLEREALVRQYLLTAAPTAPQVGDSLRIVLLAKLDSLASESAPTAQEDSLVRIVRHQVEEWNARLDAGRFRTGAEPAVATLFAASTAPFFDRLRADFSALRSAQDLAFAAAVERSDWLRRLAVGSILLESTMIFGGFYRLRGRLVKSAAKLTRAQNEVLERLAWAAEFRDDDTGRHTERVGNLSACIAAAMGFDAETVELIRRAAPLHDVGKIAIPDAILFKPGKLDEREMARMQAHTTIGSRLLAHGESSVIGMAQRIAHSHHEKWDGTGYPARLRGTQIPIEARIVAVADVFDALRSDRPYRKAWDLPIVLGEIARLRGTHFDPRVVDAFLDRRCYDDVNKAA